MGDQPGERAADFWKRAEALTAEHTGPFIDSVQNLEQTLLKYHTQLSTDIIDGREVLRTPTVTFWSSMDARRSGAPRAKALAFVDQRNHETYFALDPNIDTPEMHRFKVSRSGHLLNLDKLDAFGESFGSSEDDIALFSAAVDNIKNALFSAEWREKDQRQQRIRTIARWTGGIVAISLVGGGAALGLKEWYFEPKAEDKAARQEYDAEQHVLSTKAVPIQSQEVEAIPSEDFDEIPSHKDGEDFKSPRTIEITGNNCIVWEVATRPDDIVRVGLEEGDPLLGSTVGALIDENHKYLTICLSGPDSPDKGNSNEKEASQIAVQVLNTKQPQ